MCATRATMSHGSRRKTIRFESLRTIASSAVRSSAEALDRAAATARGTSDACIVAYPHHIVPGDILSPDNGLCISRELGATKCQNANDGIRLRPQDPPYVTLSCEPVLRAHKPERDV